MFQNEEKRNDDLEKGLLDEESNPESLSLSNPKEVIQLKTFCIGTESEDAERAIQLASTELIDLEEKSGEKEHELEDRYASGNVMEYKTKIRTFFNVIGALKTGTESEPDANQTRKHKGFQPKWTALHHASAKGQSTLIQNLLDSGDDPNVTDERGRTAIDVAGIGFYRGMHIESLTEVLKILLERNGTFNTMKEKKDSLDTPIHTAVELGCQESIKILLNAGASVASLNSSGVTPLHLCIRNKEEECLKILLTHNSKDTEAISKRANTRNHAGFTVLQAAVVKEWVPGVKVLLDCGADVTATSDLPFDRSTNVTLEDFINLMYRLEEIHETPIHLAANSGNQKILRKLLNKDKSAVNKFNLIGQSPLYIAVRGGYIGCIKTLQNMGADVMNVTKENQNALHVAVTFDQKKVVAFLLDLEYDIPNKMLNSFDNTGYAPIHSATMCNRVDCIKLLAEKNAFLRLLTKGILIADWTPLHIAASKNLPQVAEVLLKYDKATIDDVDPKGRLPIHIAAGLRNREVMAMLLGNGAVLSSQTEPDKKKGSKKIKKTTALKMISSELPNPTPFFEEVFDSFIEPNIKSEGERLIRMDYRVFTKVNSLSQIKIVEDFVKYGHQKLLIHPLVESLIYLKWRTLLPVFWVIILIHTTFALSMYTLIISDFLNDGSEIIDPDDLTTNSPSGGLFFITPLLSVIVLELMYLNIQRRRYFCQLENWIKLSSIIVASSLLTADASWNEEEWSRHAATVALLLAWAQIMFLLSRFPNMGFYVLMFGSVSLNIFKILLIFSFFILAFALCFMIQYHSQPPFGGPWEAVIKTIVMMTSEFDYENLFGEEHSKELLNSKPFVHVMFVLFLIFVSIVFVNFMVGVAVSDVNDLKMEGNIRRLEKQVEFLSTLDVLAFGFGIKRCVTKNFISKRFVNSLRIKAGVTKHWMVCYKTETDDVISSFDKEITIPSHILDNIFNIIKTKKEQNKEKKGINLLKDQVQFIYNFTTGFIERFLTKEVLERFNNERELMPRIRIDEATNGLEVRNSVGDNNTDKLIDSISNVKHSLKDRSTQTEPTEPNIRHPGYLGTRLYFKKRLILRKRNSNRNRLLQEMKSKFVEEATVFRQSQLKRFKKLERMLKKL